MWHSTGHRDRDESVISTLSTANANTDQIIAKKKRKRYRPRQRMFLICAPLHMKFMPKSLPLQGRYVAAVQLQSPIHVNPCNYHICFSVQSIEKTRLQHTSKTSADNKLTSSFLCGCGHKLVLHCFLFPRALGVDSHMPTPLTATGAILSFANVKYFG